jgi:RNA polymerase sigma-70 factor (ECF subfamily)
MIATAGTPTYARRPVDRMARALRSEGDARNQAVAELHELLLRAARFEVSRRRAALAHVRGEELEDIAMQAANDALMAVLSKLDEYRGESRFTTWAYKFALLEAAVRLRRRAWQNREVPLAAEGWEPFVARSASPQAAAERDEVFAELGTAIAKRLTPHQREVLVAITLNGVPIDVLAERLDTTRGALYKTLHDARQKLRAHLEECGLDIDLEGGESG